PSLKLCFVKIIPSPPKIGKEDMIKIKRQLSEENGNRTKRAEDLTFFISRNSVLLSTKAQIKSVNGIIRRSKSPVMVSSCCFLKRSATGIKTTAASGIV